MRVRWTGRIIQCRTKEGGKVLSAGCFYVRMITDIDINIHKKKEGDADVLVAELSNGHLEALEKIKKDYGFPSEKEAITFMLGVIAQANGTPIEVGGSKYLPSDSLKSGKP